MSSIENKNQVSQYIIANNIGAHTCIFLIFSIYVSSTVSLLLHNGLYIDDRIYLYSINFLVCEPEKLHATSRTLLDFLARGSYSIEDVSLFQFRYEYSSNYLLHAATTCLARTLLPQSLLDIDYGSWIYVVTQTGVGLSHLICFSIVLAAVWSARASKAPVIVLFTFVFLAYLAIDVSTRNWRFSNADGPLELAFQAVVFAISPGFEFELFGITPRSDATLLLVAIVVFRWQQRTGIGYWIIAFASVVHGTYGMLMLVIFLSLDGILQPAILRNWRCLLPIAAVALATFLRIRSFDAFGGTAIQIGAVVLGLAAFAGLATPAGERLFGALPPVRRLRAAPRVKAETLLLVLGMAVAVALALTLATLNSGLTAKYVAHELSGRPVALMRVPVLMGICAIVLQMKSNGFERYLPIAIGILALVTVAVEISQIRLDRKSWRTATDLESEMQATISNPKGKITRLQSYYLLSCQVDYECRYFKDLMQSAKGG